MAVNSVTPPLTAAVFDPTSWINQKMAQWDRLALPAKVLLVDALPTTPSTNFIYLGSPTAAGEILPGELVVYESTLVTSAFKFLPSLGAVLGLYTNQPDGWSIADTGANNPYLFSDGGTLLVNGNVTVPSGFIGSCTLIVSGTTLPVVSGSGTTAGLMGSGLPVGVYRLVSTGAVVILG